MIFGVDRQKIYFDQEANAVMGFTPKEEKNLIKNLKFEIFLKNYDFLVENLSFVKKEKK